MRKIRLSKIIELMFSFPKTLYFNLIVFGVRGIKLPVYISYKTKLKEIHYGTILIKEKYKPFMIKFGIGGSNGIIENSHSELCLEKNSKIVFEGTAHFAAGNSIRNSGQIYIGNNFGMNKNSFLSCYNKIEIGSDVITGWNVSIRDSDGHSLIKNNVVQPVFRPVSIGNHVWLCSYVHILKGVELGNDIVVGYRSVVTGKFNTNGIVIAGHPAKIVQEHVNWQY